MIQQPKGIAKIKRTAFQEFILFEWLGERAVRSY